MANNLAAFNSAAFSKLLVKNFDQINVMFPLVNTDYEGDLQKIGDTVYVRTLGSITMGSWTKNGTVSYQDLAPVKEAMTVADAQYFAFKVDDVDVAQNDLDALNLYAQRAAVSMNNTVEAKILSVYASALAANQITGASAAALTLTSDTSAATDVYALLVKARANLAKQNVQGMRWAVVDPDTTSLLLNDTKRFIRATDLSDAMVREGNLQGVMQTPGFIGRCAGFNVFESNAVPVATAKFLPYGVQGAINYAAQVRQVEALRLETTFANAVRGLLLHDAKVFAESAKGLGYIKATP